MRAVVVDEFGEPERLVVKEVPAPEPGPGEVAVEVDYAGVGFVDTLLRRGAFGSLLPPPFTPGIEVSGRIAGVGPEVDLPVGAPVAALLNDFGRGARGGGYAEVVVARADLAIPLPDGVEPASAAGQLVNASTARWALHRSAATAPGENVAVLGASGGVGAVGLRLAAAAGAGRVVAVVGRPESADAARRAGASDVVLRAELSGALSALTEGRGVDVVLDPVGGPARQQSLAQLAFGGRLIVVGNASGEDVEVSTDGMWHAARTVGGFSLGAAAGLVPGEVTTEAATALGLLARDGRPDDVTVVELDDVVEVHRALDAGRAPTKTVLRVAG